MQLGWKYLRTIVLWGLSVAVLLLHPVSYRECNDWFLILWFPHRFGQGDSKGSGSEKDLLEKVNALEDEVDFLSMKLKEEEQARKASEREAHRCHESCVCGVLVCICSKL